MKYVYITSRFSFFFGWIGDLLARVRKSFEPPPGEQVIIRALHNYRSGLTVAELRHVVELPCSEVDIVVNYLLQRGRARIVMDGELEVVRLY